MSDDAASPAQTVGAAERERILVCDDDPRMRDTIVEAMAMITSTSSKRKILRLSSSVLPTILRCVSAECR